MDAVCPCMKIACKSHVKLQLHEVGSDPLRSWPRTVHTHTHTHPRAHTHTHTRTHTHTHTLNLLKPLPVLKPRPAQTHKLQLLKAFFLNPKPQPKTSSTPIYLCKLASCGTFEDPKSVGKIKTAKTNLDV